MAVEQVWCRVGDGSLLHGVVPGWSGVGEADKVWAVACVCTGAMIGTWMLHGCLQGHADMISCMGTGQKHGGHAW